MRHERFRAWLLLAILLSCLMPQGASAATSGLDVVILIDRSGTMRQTDPGNIAQEAAKQFIDLCEMQNTSVAVLGFNHKIVNGSEVNFIPVDDVTGRDQLKAAIDSFPKSKALKNEDTDTGMALMEAYNLITARKSQHPDHQFAILLLSDGEIDLGDVVAKGDPALNQQLVAESRRKADDVAEWAADNDTKIFSIGLYNSKDPKAVPNRGDLEHWSQVSGGEIEVVGDANELPDVLTRFFEAINQSVIAPLSPTPDDKKVYKFIVPDNVFETNIVIAMKDKAGLASVALYDPSGNPVSLAASSRGIFVSDKSDTYKSIKIKLPVKGEWKIVLNKEYEDIKVTMVNNFDLNMVLTLQPGSVQKNGAVTATLEATRQNVPYDGDGHEVLLVILKDGQEIESLPMSYDAGAQRHILSFPAGTEGDLTAIARIETENMLNVSNEAAFAVVNTPVSLSSATLSDPIVIRAWMPMADGQEAVVTDSLKGLFADADGDGYSVDASIDAGGKGLAEARIDGDRLLLRGLAQGETALTITARGDDGTTKEIVRDVYLTDFRETFKRYALIALAALVALIVLIILLVRASKPAYKRYSSLGITIQDAMSGDGGADSISLQRFGKKKVKLSVLASGILRSATGLRGYSGPLSRITIEPTKSGSIRVRSKLKSCRCDEGLAPGDSKTLDLQGNGNMTVLLEYT